MIERDTFHRNVPTMLPWPQFDSVIPTERFERLDFEQRNLRRVFRTLGIEAPLVSQHITIALNTSSGDQRDFRKGPHRKKRTRRLVQKAYPTLPHKWLTISNDCRCIHAVIPNCALAAQSPRRRLTQCDGFTKTLAAEVTFLAKQCRASYGSAFEPV